jgi:hypothetical protein
MTPLQTELIRVGWQQVQSIRAAAAELFYRPLLEWAAEMRPLCKRDLPAQGAMLIPSAPLHSHPTRTST